MVYCAMVTISTVPLSLKLVMVSMSIQASLELAIDRGNQSAIVDVLSVLNLRRSLWTLDMALLVLPEVRLILRSNHNR